MKMSEAHEVSFLGGIDRDAEKVLLFQTVSIIPMAVRERISEAMNDELHEYAPKCNIMILSSMINPVFNMQTDEEMDKLGWVRKE